MIRIERKRWKRKGSDGVDDIYNFVYSDEKVNMNEFWIYSTQSGSSKSHHLVKYHQQPLSLRSNDGRSRIVYKCSNVINLSSSSNPHTISSTSRFGVSEIFCLTFSRVRAIQVMSILTNGFRDRAVPLGSVFSRVPESLGLLLHPSPIPPNSESQS